MARNIYNGQKIIMVAPHPNGKGGISRVIHLWQNAGFIFDFNIKLIASVENNSNKLKVLIFALFLFIRECAGKSRMVYIHTASYNSFYRKSLFLLTSYVLRKKIILHIHPNYFYHFIKGFKGFKKILFFWLLRKVDIFIVLTEDMQQKIRSLFAGCPVHVLRNPVDIERMRCRKPIDREKNRFLFLGWFNRDKGVYDLVDAAELLSTEGENFSIDFYGTKEIDKLKRYVSTKGLNQIIKVNDWVGENQKKQAFYRSAALILPSHTEGIPNVILEAMATKTPIISTLVGGLTEVLGQDKNAVIIEPRNSRDIANKIKFVLHNRKYCQDLAENAYREACEKYNLYEIKKQFQAILASI